MIKRGKVLRDTSSGPGLLIMEGQQYRFSRERIWKSAVPPKPGLVVDVELDAAGGVQGITVVPDSQLAKEHAQAARALAGDKDQSQELSIVSRIGMPNLVVAGLLAAAWFFLTAASVQVPFPATLELTFWQILGFLNSGSVPEFIDGNRSPGAGVYGLAALVALAGPFFHLFWKNKRALLGGLLPLLFMIMVGIAVRGSLSALGGGDNTEMTGHAHGDVMTAVSLGLGAYLSILASLYFAFVSAKKLFAGTSERQTLESTPRKAA